LIARHGAGYNAGDRPLGLVAICVGHVQGSGRRKSPSAALRASTPARQGL